MGENLPLNHFHHSPQRLGTPPAPATYSEWDEFQEQVWGTDKRIWTAATCGLDVFAVTAVLIGIYRFSRWEAAVSAEATANSGTLGQYSVIVTGLPRDCTDSEVKEHFNKVLESHPHVGVLTSPPAPTAHFPFLLSALHSTPCASPPMRIPASIHSHGALLHHFSDLPLCLRLSAPLSTPRRHLCPGVRRPRLR